VKKASIQLSVNFLVVLIISIIILGLGFFLVNSMADKGSKSIFEMDQKFKNNLEQLLVRENRLVAIPIVEREIDRGKGNFFGIGVMNLDLISQTFKINVTFHEAYNKRTGNTLTNTDNIDSWIRNIEKEKEIKPHDKYAFSVGFAVPRNVQTGLYIFNVSITNSTSTPADDCFSNYLECYDKSLHKLYVIVN
jgi:hypothetical protein